VAVIVAIPSDATVRSPLLEMVAAGGFDDDHVA
jgi:hypothetical protein